MSEPKFRPNTPVRARERSDHWWEVIDSYKQPITFSLPCDVAEYLVDCINGWEAVKRAVEVNSDE